MRTSYRECYLSKITRSLHLENTYVRVSPTRESCLRTKKAAASYTTGVGNISVQGEVYCFFIYERASVNHLLRCRVEGRRGEQRVGYGLGVDVMVGGSVYRTD